MAYAYEQRTKFRDSIRPIILPKTELVNRLNAGSMFDDEL